ncbi:MAG: DUF6599 family protein [Planctomycetota bacterium]
MMKPTGILVFFFLAAMTGFAGPQEIKADKPGLADMKSLFPEAKSVHEAMEAEEYKEYDRGSLFDYINGGAEVYLDLGFIRVGARDYMLEIDGEEVYFTLDLYDMGTPLNAFGIFSQERYGDVPMIDVGVAGYMGGGALTCWNGRYYVKVRADSEGERVNKILMIMARSLDGKIGKPGQPPSELDLFPEPFKLKNREKYSSSNILGFGFLKGFTGFYKNQDQELKLYLCLYDEEKEAIEAEKNLVSKLKPSPSEDGQGFLFDAKYQGKGRIIRVGPYLILAQGLTGNDEQDAWKHRTIQACIDSVSGRVVEKKALKETKSEGEASGAE